MKLFETIPVLTEMAAKKECPICKKSMAANHYWYKGGWKCKKEKTETAQKVVDDKKQMKGETTTQYIQRIDRMDPHYEERKNYKHITGADIEWKKRLEREKDDS